jgi:hypothetical protein
LEEQCKGPFGLLGSVADPTAAHDQGFRTIDEEIFRDEAIAPEVPVPSLKQPLKLRTDTELEALPEVLLVHRCPLMAEPEIIVFLFLPLSFCLPVLVESKT